MKRKWCSKRRRKELSDSALDPTHLSNTTNFDRNEGSNTVAASPPREPVLELEQTEQSTGNEQNMNTDGQQEPEPYVARHKVESTNMDQHEEQISADRLIVSDIGIINRNNSAQMHSFLKIALFEIPFNIPKDSNNHAFP